MYYVGTCPVCEQGTLGLRTCGGCQDVVVLCDECDAVWLYPDCAGEAIYPAQPDLPCPKCGGSLHKGNSHWASREEIDQVGWSDAIEGSCEPSSEA